jgi:hypothetical protein
MLIFYIFGILRVPIDAVKQTTDIRKIFAIEDILIPFWIFVEGLLFIFLMLVTWDSHIFSVYGSDVYSSSMLQIVWIRH